MNFEFEPLALFSIPIWRDHYREFHHHRDSMISAASAYRDSNPNSVMSNLNGYQSPKLLHSLPEFKHLFDYISVRINKAAISIGLLPNIAITEAWVNFNDSRECMNFQHIHSGVLSGIFYLSTPDNSGKLNLVNPGINPMWQGLGIRNTQTQYTSEVFYITPKEGTLIIWPSYLPHSVGTNHHNDVRISIAFNTDIIRN